LPVSWQIDRKATELVSKDLNDGFEISQRAHKTVQKKELGTIFITPQLVRKFILF
jgi:hypothetical protein